MSPENDTPRNTETPLTLGFLVLVCSGLWLVETLNDGVRLLACLIIVIAGVYVIGAQRTKQRLMGENDTYRRWLVSLHATSGRISAKMELGETLRAIAEGLPNLIPHDECMILLLEPRTNLLTLKSIPRNGRPLVQSTIRAGRSRSGLPLAELKIAADYGLFRRITETKQAVLLNDLDQVSYEPGILAGYRSFLGSPLVSEQELLGVLVLLGEHSGSFNADHEHLLNVVAAQSATAIKNAQLYRVSQQMAFTDGLTKVFNRRFFEDQLHMEVTRGRRYHHTTSLMMIDVDFFKRFNDTYGHPIGDDVLTMIGKTLGASTRETDIVARYGGEEFVVILPETGIETAIDVAERIRKNVMAQHIAGPDNEALGVTISIGVASDHGEEASHAALIEAADACLHQSKQMGRNRVVAQAQPPRTPDVAPSQTMLSHE